MTYLNTVLFSSVHTSEATSDCLCCQPFCYVACFCSRLLHSYQQREKNKYILGTALPQLLQYPTSEWRIWARIKARLMGEHEKYLEAKKITGDLNSFTTLNS